MTWKEQLHPSVSKAEIDVFKELSRRGLTSGMVTGERAWLKFKTVLPNGEVITRKTKPDYLWIYKRITVYLDGEQVHQKRREWDEQVQAGLEKEGFSVLRIPYRAPLPEDSPKLMEVVNQIQAFLGGA